MTRRITRASSGVIARDTVCTFNTERGAGARSSVWLRIYSHAPGNANCTRGKYTGFRSYVRCVLAPCELWHWSFKQFFFFALVVAQVLLYAYSRHLVCLLVFLAGFFVSSKSCLGMPYTFQCFLMK